MPNIANISNNILTDSGVATSSLQPTITLTTTGTSGASTLISNTLNIPNYGSALTGYVPTSRTLNINGTSYDLSADRSWSVGTVTSVAALTIGTTGTDLSSSVATNTTTPVITLNVPTASAANRGALSSADWSTFNTKVGGVTATTPLFSSGGSTPNITIQQSSGSQAGYLSSTDWTTFNNKQVAGSYITSLTGEATATGPGAAAVTLDNASVTAKILTGVNITGGTVLSTDTILAAFGKLQNQVNGLIGGSIYQGTWNASTNTPTLTSSVGTQGYYYIVSVAGNTNLNGITDWFVGDWAIFNGGVWQQVDNTDAVVSVNGQTGAVSLTTDNISEGVTNLYYTDTRARASLSFVAGSGAYNSSTGAITIPTNTSQLTNGANFITLASLSGTAPISYNSGTGAISITQSGTASNGYLSSTDWNTFNNKQSALTNPVLASGSWTSNYIPKINGTYTLTNSLLYDGGSSIGVNTNAPHDSTQFKLDVNGGLIVKNSSGTLAQIVLIDANPSGGGNAGFVQHTVGGTSAAAWAQIQTFYGAANAEGALRLQPSTGQILVGSTTASAFKVDITGTLRLSGQLTLGSTITNGTYTYTLPGATGTLALVGGSGVGTVTSVSFTLGGTGTDLNSSVANSTTTPAITLNVPTASASSRGALSAADWTTFNNKQATITLTTTGTSGAATLVGATLNIPNYGSALTGYVPYTGANQNVALGSNTLQVNEKIGTTDNKGFYLRGISDITHKIYFNSTSSNIILEYNNALLFQFYNTGVPVTRFTFATNGDLTAVGNILGANLSGTNTGDVSIGTANGLSLSGQVLSLALASTSATGALSSTDWNTFNGKVSSQWVTNGTAIYYNVGRVAIGKTTSNSQLEVYGGTKGQIRVNGGTAMGAGIDFYTELAGADRRNWAIFTEDVVDGDFTIKMSASAGASPTIQTLTITKTGEVSVFNFFNVTNAIQAVMYLNNSTRAGGLGRNWGILNGNLGAGIFSIKDETAAANRFSIATDGVVTSNVSVAIGTATDASAYMRISENQIWRTAGGTLYINNSGSGQVVIASGGGIITLGTTTQGGGAYITTKDAGITNSNFYFGTGQVRIGGGSDHTTNTVLSVAPGVVQFDRPGVAGGALQINSSGYVYVGTAAALQSAEQFAVSGSGTAIFGKTTGGTNQWAQKLWNNATTGDNLILEFLTETTLTARGSIKYDRVGDMLNISGTGGGLKFSSNILSSGTLNFAQPVGIGFANGQYIKDNGTGGLFIVSGAAINMTGTTITGNTNFVIHSNGSASIGNSTQIGTLYIAGETTIATNANIRSNGGYMTLQSASGNVGVGMVPNLKLSVFNDGSIITGGTVTFATQAKGIEIYNNQGGTTDNLVGCWFSTGPHKAGIASGRTNAASTWGVDLRFFVHGPEIAQLDQTYEKMRLGDNGTLTVVGDVVAYGSPSDSRLKIIKEKVPNALASVLKLNGYRFDWKETNHLKNYKEDIGVIAQEVAELFPELARTNVDGNMSVRYQGLTAVLIEAIKEQQKQIDNLKKQLV